MRSQESQTMSRPVTSVRYQSRRAVIEQMAPRYREASLAQKVLLLDTVVARTGYARKYAIRLLNEPSEGQHVIQRRRLPRYGSEVQQALMKAWKASRYICAERLIPFLPTLVTSLERHGHLQLTEESRSQLLAMSTSTAERVLRTQHKPVSRGLATTRAGSLLKHQIPIRTFQGWDEATPGFVEADLVVHGGGDREGSFLLRAAARWPACPLPDAEAKHGGSACCCCCLSPGAKQAHFCQNHLRGVWSDLCLHSPQSRGIAPVPTT